MTDTKRTELFEHCSVLSAVLRLAFPTVIGQIILVLYNMADTFFIGLTGSDTMLTAVTVCMPAFMFLSAVSNLFGIGGASVISRALGRQDRSRASCAAAFAFWGCLLTTALYSLLAFLFRHWFLNLLGGTAQAVHVHCVRYLFCTVILGGLPTAMNAFLSHLIRAEGRSVQASVGIALGGILNIALDPLFMFVLLPPGQEALGAAIATALSNVIALLYFVVLFLKDGKTSVLSFRPCRACMEDGIPRAVLNAGLPACMMTLCENISYAVLDKLMSFNGIAAQAGIGVAKKVNMLAHCIVRGISQGALPLIGYNYASGNHKRMKSALALSCSFSVGMAALCMAASLLFHDALIGIFIPDGGESLHYGAAFLEILCLGGPFSAAAYTVISFFQATGKGMTSFLLAILRKGLVDIPLMFVINALLPIYGIVWATPVTDVICCIAAALVFARFRRRQLIRV